MTPVFGMIATLVPAEVSIAKSIDPPPPPLAVTGQGDVARLDLRGLVTAVRAHDVDLKPVIGDAVGKVGAPLHDDDGCREVDVEIVELHGAAQPVGVDVHERVRRGSLRGCVRARTNVGLVTAPRTRRGPRRCRG